METKLSNEEKAVTEALKWCVTHTPYSIYQYMRVIEVSDKYGEKTIYHLTKKQGEMYKFITTAIQVQLYTQLGEKD